MKDWKEVIGRLEAVRGAAAALKDPKDSRLRAGIDNARKEYARQEQGVLDELVQLLQERARPVVLVGGTPSQQARFGDVAKRLPGVTVVDASAVYDTLAQEVGIRSGVARLESTRAGFVVHSVATKRQQLVAEMMMWVQHAARPKWTSDQGSYYGRAAALASTLCQPAHLTSADTWFQDWPSLVAAVKRQFQLTNQQDQFGKVSVLDGLRAICDQARFHEDPVVVVQRTDYEKEARNVASLFQEKPAFVRHGAQYADLLGVSSWPDGEVTRKFVQDIVHPKTPN